MAAALIAGAVARGAGQRWWHHARARWASGLLALAVHGLCWGQLTQPETEWLFASLTATHRKVEAGDWQACLAELDRSAELAHRNWTQTSLSWFGVRLRCEARALQARGEAVGAETLARLSAPALEHLARMPPGVEHVTGARLRWLHGKWWLMQDLGLGDDAERDERQVVQVLLDADAIGADATARDELNRWANDFYGYHEQLPRIQSLLRWIGERHGPGHRAALYLRRAVSFAWRSADRSAEALALMDETARLALQHHPGDVDLQRLIAGERAPCLVDNGLWLEARDEFIALRDWMLQRVPLPHGNLMRMNYHLAAIANTLGDHDQAEAFAEAAQRHARASSLPNDRVEVEVAHLHKAEARMLRGLPGAVDELRRQLERNTPNEGGTGAPAFGLAKLARRSGDAELLDWAQDFLHRHAHMRLQPMQPSRALTEIATAWSLLPNDPVRARALLDRALTRSLSGREPSVGVQTAFAMARELAPAQPDAAIWWFKRGTNHLQALRQRGRAAQDEGMHRATLADHEADLRAFIALLIDEGRYLEARDAMRVLREEELHDFARRSRRRAAAARGGALAFTAQEQRFEGALRPLVERMVAEQTLADARARPAPLESARSKGWLDDPVADALLGRTQAELHALLQDLRAPARRSGTPPAVPGAGEPLAPGSARLQYFVREQAVDVLVTTAKGWHRHSVPISRVELNRRVHAWRAALLDPTADAMAGARALHDLLLRPLRAQLAGVRQLRVGLDGALRYLPLAALHDGQRHLVQRYRLVMDDGIEVAIAAQPASPRQAPRADGAVLRLAAFGRSAPDADHAALPGVDAELESLAALAPPRGATPPDVRVLRDTDFTAQALQLALAESPRVVHIASHFHLAAAEEESSYLLLGDGERLPLSRLAQMPWDRVRLVLLSACDSAVGDTPGLGREFNGLAGVLRQAGAGNVLASLWPIADASTAAFMREFYRPWAARGAASPRAVGRRVARAEPVPDAGWLADAQRRWLARHPSGAFAHPYHWAAFVWWGNADQGRAGRAE
ncbi:MAG: CHAT domain-containing protein [Burkholderiaceae bacterium]